ncbi:MAG: patatin-like phospholipase family protein [Treponema sp.]|nr:patatin-like phospholipase family protein [Treponema sp.]
MKKRIITLLTAAAFLVFQLYAEPQLESTIKEETLPSPPKPKGRPSVALVLSGGGARGFAHIPVLELLEEEHIPVDMVVGNSAGAICGALYCAGYTPKQILEQMYEFSSGAVLKDAPYSPFEQILGGHSTLNAPVRIQFGSMGQTFSLGMGNGVLTGQNVYELFKKLTIRLPSNLNFDDLPVPFRAVATNLIKGKIEVLDSGDIAEAVRSSMSIPGLFQPFEKNGQYYVDGLALDDTPVDVAVKMGYDIIIVSSLSDGMENDPEKFDANPLVAVLQMINMDQAARNKNNDQFVALSIYPDYADETLISYARGAKIYNASKKSMEQYRNACKKLYNQIYSSGKSAENEQTEKKYKNSYEDNKYLSVNHILIHNADKADETFIIKQYEKIQDKKITESDFMELSDSIYHTGRYRSVITRITGEEGDRTLELILRPEQKEYGIVLLSGNLAGTVAMDSTLGFALSSDIQWRGLTGYGSVISAKVSGFDGFSGELMFRHPLSSRVFSQTTLEYRNNSYSTGAGWVYSPSSLMTIQKATANQKFGISLAGTNNVLSAGAGINWFDTRDAVEDGVSMMTGDFFESCTLNTLDSTCFPTRGMYASIQGTGVLPISRQDDIPVFDITQADFIKAVPLGNAFNLIFEGFAGTDISQQLNKFTGLKPVYGFSLADRRFFPQISSQSPWYIHKAVISSTLQFSPRSDLSVFGMKTLLFISGAVGNIWDSYEEMTLKDLQWRASFDAGLSIQDNFGILLRIGTGTTKGYVLPFVSLDIGNIRF